MTTLHLKKSISWSPLRRGFPVVLLVLGLFAFSPTARAVDPPPDGGYPNANTAEGDNALLSITTGNNNTADGNAALYSDTTGSENTALGVGALYYNTSGNFNTATGVQALLSNTTGDFNTATGNFALISNSSGSNNTATGAFALDLNRKGSNNTADGFRALLNNTAGNGNTANGANALSSNTSGLNNTAIGADALLSSIGSGNAAVGSQALMKIRSGTNNIALGNQAGVNASSSSSNNIYIGNSGEVTNEVGRIRIGTTGLHLSTTIAGIYGSTVATGVPVIIGPGGHLGTVQSSARFKEAIKPMGSASEAILALQPVTFHYKHELDPDGIPQFGLVAEQVEKVNPDLVVRGGDGKVMTVRYEAVNAMLLNEFLKEHRKVEEQDQKVHQLEAIAAQQKHELDARIAQQQKQIEALISTVQKVSEQLERTQHAPQMASNDR